MIKWMVKHLRETITPERRVRGSMWILLFCIVAWPLSSVTIFYSPSLYAQALIGLSWLAIIGEALILIVTTDIRQEQDD